MPTRRSDILGAIDRHLWRDLGFADPEPQILQFLPMLVVAWADGRLSVDEADRIRDRARTLPVHLRGWMDERLQYPPGPYFRYQVAHLLAFMLCTWCRGGDDADWIDAAEQWANDLIADAGWFRRMFGGLNAEIRDLNALRRAVHEGQIFAGDRIWALARGAHAVAEPRRAVAILPEDAQVHQALGIVLEGDDERIAVANIMALSRDEDLDPHRVEELLAGSRHLREPERWILLAGELSTSGRALTTRQRAELNASMEKSVGGPFEEVAFAELAYLEDALALDARWVSWVAGQVEELRINHHEVVRPQIPGTFYAPRQGVSASVAKQLVTGPPGLGFRVLNLASDAGSLRLASPVVTQEPATKETIQWIARFLPSMCDPWTQLVLDEDGPRWIAEVLPDMACKPSTAFEPLLPGRALLVPPWVWFRAADAMGVRFFSAKRKISG